MHSGQRAVCVFSEILVTGRVQEVDEAVLVMEGHDRGRYRNPPLALDFHKIRRGGFGDLVVLHRACRLNRPPNSKNFSVKVVFPASGWLMMAKVLRR